MNFCSCLEFLRDRGATLTRDSWNGAEIFIADIEGIQKDISPGQWRERQCSYVRAKLPCLCMRLRDGRILMGWSPNQDDLFATDWVLVEER
jgi:hypothetical protein